MQRSNFRVAEAPRASSPSQAAYSYRSASAGSTLAAELDG